MFQRPQCIQNYFALKEMNKIKMSPKITISSKWMEYHLILWISKEIVLEVLSTLKFHCGSFNNRGI